MVFLSPLLVEAFGFRQSILSGEPIAFREISRFGCKHAYEQGDGFGLGHSVSVPEKHDFLDGCSLLRVD
jgi:hypothetical protein